MPDRLTDVGLAAIRERVEQAEADRAGNDYVNGDETGEVQRAAWNDAVEALRTRHDNPELDALVGITDNDSPEELVAMVMVAERPHFDAAFDVLVADRAALLDEVERLRAQVAGTQAKKTTVGDVLAWVGEDHVPAFVQWLDEHDRQVLAARQTRDWLTVAEAAKALGVTPSAVRQRLHSGSLRGERVGRDWQIPAEAIVLKGA